MKISVCGKGGSGKSTVITLLAKSAQKRGVPVLIVDSDESNSGLFRMVGFKSPPTPLMELVGGKSELKKKMQEPSIFERSEIDIKEIPSQYIQREDGLMLVSIGKILQSLEGCACPMGVLNREFLKKLRFTENGIVLIDMEAGIEHFGRGVDEGIDKVILVVEPSFESVNIAEKIRDLAVSMNKGVSAILNKVSSEEVLRKIEGELKKRNIKIIGAIPNDPLVFDACLAGNVLDRGKAFDAAERVLDDLLPER
ncbi:MAG: P-loop NTPase [Deltaproteobacteria bacterium]|nr:P-loop NTPase [Deltaproteobacteria bacterium]